MDFNGSFKCSPFFPKGCEVLIAKLAEQDPLFPTRIERWVSLAERGDAHARLNLAVIHYRAGNMLEFTELLRRIAEEGDPEAMARYATALVHGVGTIKNLSMALSWFSEAAKHGHVVGIYGCAFCYLNGEGVTKDIEVGLHFMKKAADLGYPQAVTYMKHPQTRALEARTHKWS